MSSASWQRLHHEDVIITEESVSGQSDGKKTKGPGDGLAGELIAVGRKNKTLAEPEAGTRQDLSLKKIPEDRRNVGGITILVHHSDFASEQKLEARGERIDVWCGNHGDATWCEEAPDIAQEIDGALDMLDDLDGGDKIERSRAELDGKARLVEIKRNEGKTTFVDSGILVNRNNITTERVETFAHCSRSCAKIRRASARLCMMRKDFGSDEFVQTLGRGR